jgi:acetolactate synthase-1/2/3 large subunit
MIYTGGGVILANASNELNRLVDKLGFPVTNTLMGLGAYRASSEPLRRHAGHARHLRSEHGDAALRRPDRHRRPLRRPRDRQPEALRQHPRKIIHIDIDPSSISKRVKVDIPIVGNVKDVLVELLAQLDAAEQAESARRATGGSRSANGAAATA